MARLSSAPSWSSLVRPMQPIQDSSSAEKVTGSRSSGQDRNVTQDRPEPLLVTPVRTLHQDLDLLVRHAEENNDITAHLDELEAVLTRYKATHTSQQILAQLPGSIQILYNVVKGPAGNKLGGVVRSVSQAWQITPEALLRSFNFVTSRRFFDDLKTLALSHSFEVAYPVLQTARGQRRSGNGPERVPSDVQAALVILQKQVAAQLEVDQTVTSDTDEHSREAENKRSRTIISCLEHSELEDIDLAGAVPEHDIVIDSIDDLGVIPPGSDTQDIHQSSSIDGASSVSSHHPHPMSTSPLTPNSAPPKNLTLVSEDSFLVTPLTPCVSTMVMAGTSTPKPVEDAHVDQDSTPEGQHQSTGDQGLTKDSCHFDWSRLPPGVSERLRPGVRLNCDAMNTLFDLISGATPPGAVSILHTQIVQGSSPPLAARFEAMSESQTILLPLHLPKEEHWVLAVCRHSGPFEIWDSLFSQSPSWKKDAESAAMNALSKVSPRWLPNVLANFDWKLGIQQENDTDCGVAVLVNAMYILTERLSSEPVDMSLWRRVLETLLTPPRTAMTAWKLHPGYDEINLVEDEPITLRKGAKITGQNLSAAQEMRREWKRKMMESITSQVSAGTERLVAYGIRVEGIRNTFNTLRTAYPVVMSSAELQACVAKADSRRAALHKMRAIIDPAQDEVDFASLLASRCRAMKRRALNIQYATEGVDALLTQLTLELEDVNRRQIALQQLGKNTDLF
ncbi:hypothetical protein GCG54_00015313 [Colletotrichum gloeosporioides]|uniref:Ubiquitin-like protease family profile domain-containing protein n=1 Tax=Colletotrichum gloeosporioides TaxID=474922 RepID=A0A8H4FET2_COLGL|nr:uncharacterized protein GCG54_00015313 [Colletotrichum gloeosporioides]KAF3799131.1 hypothetical protein GCG54_00015313 [Colletotrichum gloeosporioides]